MARLFERHDKTGLRYEALTEEPVCAITRPGHPLQGATRLKLRDLVDACWIVPPAGSMLRHRFELMFQEQGMDAPANVVETTALLFITRMLQQSDMMAVIATDVARYYAQHGLIAPLPIQLACTMDDFGIITRTDRLPSPATQATLAALKRCALTVYGTGLGEAVPDARQA